MKRTTVFLTALLLSVGIWQAVPAGQTQRPAGQQAAVAAEKPDRSREPFLPRLSLSKATDYLDAGARAHEKNCLACHATFAYLALDACGEIRSGHRAFSTLRATPR